MFYTRKNEVVSSEFVNRFEYNSMYSFQVNTIAKFFNNSVYKVLINFIYEYIFCMKFSSLCYLNSCIGFQLIGKMLTTDISPLNLPSISYLCKHYNTPKKLLFGFLD